MAFSILKLHRRFVDLNGLLLHVIRCSQNCRDVSALKVCRSKPHYYHYSLIDPSSSTCQFFSDDAKLTSREGYLEGQANSDTSTRVLKQSSCVSDDFFGFENGEGVVIVNEEEDMDEEQVNVVEKYSRLFEKKPAPAEEKVFVTNFGSIRYDSDNPPHPHKDQPEYASTESMEEQEVNYETESGFIEGQYFSEGQRKDEVSSEQPFMNSGNYIEEHYFGSSGVKDSLLCHSTSWDDVGPTTSNLSSEFGVHSNLINRVNQNGDIESIRTKSDFQRLRIHANRELENEPINTKKRNEDWYNLESKSEETDMGKIKMTPLEKKSMERMKANIRMPQTAYDFVARLRTQETVNDKELEEMYLDYNQQLPLKPNVDSQGSRIYKDQVHDLDSEPALIVLQILKNSILFNECDIVGLSKPYGLPTHSGEGHRHCLTSFLPELAAYLSKGNTKVQLYTVHRLDKETTGVLLLAKTQVMAQKLHLLLAQRKIVKTYWALTKGVPSPPRGIIDIPIAEGVVDGKSKMVLRPDDMDLVKMGFQKKRSTKSQKAVTEYTVLSSHGNAALVELVPQTGVKHQIRVHLASGLGCPVLGDHKFSHHTKLAPQKLPSDMLESLDVRQSKVRYIPMHLHARAVVIPEIVDGRNIHIAARLPRHFKENMKRLKIRKENGKI